MSHKFVDSGYEVVDGARICERCGNSPSHEYHELDAPMTDNPAKAPEPTPEMVEKHVFQKWGGVMRRLADSDRDSVPAQVAPVCSVCRKPIEKVDPHAKWTHVEGMDAIRCQSGELYPQPAVPAQVATCDCGNAISMGPKGWTHEDSDQRGCERANPAAQPVSAPSPEIPDSLLKWWKECDARFSPDEMWAAFKGAVEANVALTKLESALRTAREDRDRLRRNQDEVERERDYFYRAMAALRAERDGEREARKQEAAQQFNATLGNIGVHLLLRFKGCTSLNINTVVVELSKLSKPVSGSPERLEEQPEEWAPGDFSDD